MLLKRKPSTTGFVHLLFVANETWSSSFERAHSARASVPQQVVGSLYLPSFLRTFLGNPLTASTGAHAAIAYYVLWACHIGCTPAFHCFARRHPETSRDFCASLLKLFASIDPEVIKVSNHRVSLCPCDRRL